MRQLHPFILACSVGAALAANAHHTEAATVAPIAEVVAAERAFAARAQVVDARDAFVENFATDAVSFAPAPGPAFPGLKEGPPWGLNIRWRPSEAGASRAGDLGWTTGPAEYRRDRNAKDPNSWGFYTSVWAKQSDGAWKVIADIGTHTPMPTLAIADWQPADQDQSGRHGAERKPRPPSARALERMRMQLLGADRRLADHAARNAAQAFDGVLTTDSRVHRDGAPPAIGRNAAFDALRDGATTYDWSAQGGRVSVSGDLGFTYGSGVTHNTTGATPFHYLAIWEQHDGAWKLRVLVQNPVKPKKA